MAAKESESLTAKGANPRRKRKALPQRTLRNQLLKQRSQRQRQEWHSGNDFEFTTGGSNTIGVGLAGNL
jgi:hypothetical protein